MVRLRFLGVSLAVGLVAVAAACARGESDDALAVDDQVGKTEPPAEASTPLPPRGDAASGADGSDGLPPDDAGADAEGGADATSSLPDAAADGGLPTSLANGLVLYMNFDSATAVDVTGHHLPAAITVTTVTSAPDRYGHAIGAARFNATPSSLIQVGPPNMMPLGNAERSMSLWVRPRIAAPPPPPSSPNSNVFIHWGIDDCTSKMFGLGNRVDHGFAWTGCVDIDSSLSVPVATWTFMASTYKSDGTLTLVVGTSRVTRPNVTLQTTSAPLAIGGERRTYGQGFTSYFDGDLDDIRVWNRALSDPELAALAAEH